MMFALVPNGRTSGPDRGCCGLVIVTNTLVVLPFLCLTDALVLPPGLGEFYDAKLADDLSSVREILRCEIKALLKDAANPSSTDKGDNDASMQRIRISGAG
jgi:hypothetical protein